MHTTIADSTRQSLLDRLKTANENFQKTYPGVQMSRQPVHTLYGGANLYKAGAAQKLGNLAVRHLEAYAPTPAALERELGMKPAIAAMVFERVSAKLAREPVEDQRLDFEDGYGVRADEEEDGHAIAAAEAVAEGMREGTLPPFIGIRVKALSEEAKVRSLRTLDLFLTRLAELTNGELPDPFYVTLPKVTLPEQVTVICEALAGIEQACAIKRPIRLELMIETIQSILTPKGDCAIPALIAAGGSRVSSAILGTFDYTASCNIAGSYQDHRHPSADFARQMMQVSLTGTEVTLCDGITNIMPIAPHRGENLTTDQVTENNLAVYHAWREHYGNIMHSLSLGFYQSWDLNPAQLPLRFLAVYAFFLEGLDDASARLTRFIDQAAQASMVGNTFDDAASAQGILNYFVSGINCGALTEEEALQTGITMEELAGRSFARIVENRLRR